MQGLKNNINTDSSENSIISISESRESDISRDSDNHGKHSIKKRSDNRNKNIDSNSRGSYEIRNTSNNSSNSNKKNSISNNSSDSYKNSNISSNSSGSYKNQTIHTDYPDISSICSGVDYFNNQSNTAIVFVDNVTDCDNTVVGFTSHQGVVYGRCQDSRTFCHLHIEVAQPKRVQVDVWSRGKHGCSVYLFDFLPESLTLTPHYRDFCSFFGFGQIKRAFPSKNHVYISHHNKPHVYIEVKDIQKEYLSVTFTSPYSGYLRFEITEGWYLGYIDYRKDVEFPQEYVIRISTKNFSPTGRFKGHIKIYHEVQQKAPSIVISLSRFYKIFTPAAIFNARHLQINLIILPCHPATLYFYITFLYSAKKKSKTLNEVIDVFNCSKSDYSYEGGEVAEYCRVNSLYKGGQTDMEHCPSKMAGLTRWVASRNKCFQLSSQCIYNTVKEARAKCWLLGGKLPSFRTEKEWDEFIDFMLPADGHQCFTGLSSGWSSVPFMYSQFRKWADNTLVYNMDFFLEIYVPSRTHKTSAVYIPYPTPLAELQEIATAVACEYDSLTKEQLPYKTVVLPAIHNTSSILSEGQIALIICSGGYFTHSFLLCDVKSHCGQTTHASHCMCCNESKRRSKNILSTVKTSSAYKVAMFACDDDLTTLPYALVCDFRQDCPDNSDESFCQHPACESFQCTNGQCVSVDQRCNEYSDCLDDSDEVGCPDINTKPATKSVEQQPFLINLDGTGYFTQQKMKADESCPDTHYRCTSEWLYCLPVYARCNGFGDCINHEDEMNCDRTTCPGFYRCRASSVCVHVNHLCDGWGQCPQRDDEWLCDMTCPVSCLCLGLSLVCPQPFSAHLFPQLHYLDATGSGMTPSDLSNNTHLVRLSLASCSLVFLPYISFSNMQFIDLRRNNLIYITINVFVKLLNLRVLLLAENPLTSIVVEPTNLTQNALRKVDLSETRLYMFDSESFRYFPLVQSVNLSFSPLNVIGSGGFHRIPRLTGLDIRGNEDTKFSTDVFLGLNLLSIIFSSNYRMCCQKIISKLAKTIQCIAPQPTLSSCENLLSSELYKLMFWSVSVLAVCGNSMCFISQYITKKTSFGSTIITSITNLQIGNLCAGIHTSIITAANELFHGEYLLYENVWTESVTCKVAGFLCFLQSEMSIVTVWFITLDHIVVLCFPFSTFRFNKRSAAVSCGLTWLFGLSLASAPFLPGLSQSRVYGQTSICHPLMFHKRYSKQGLFLLQFIFTLNVVMCLLIGSGQIIICRKTPKTRMTADDTQKSVFSSVDLVVKVGVTTVVCWSSITITSVIAILGVPVSEQLHVVMAVFVLPLNSALYPLLYCWSGVNNKRQQHREQRVLQSLKARLARSGAQVIKQ